MWQSLDLDVGKNSLEILVSMDILCSSRISGWQNLGDETAFLPSCGRRSDTLKEVSMRGGGETFEDVMVLFNHKI